MSNRRGRDKPRKAVTVSRPNTSNLRAATCPCGKLGHPSRKAAKQAGRRAHPDGGLNAYRCPNPGAIPGHEWHYGHLPAPVKAGRQSRDDLTAVAPRPPRLRPGASPLEVAQLRATSRNTAQRRA